MSASDAFFHAYVTAALWSSTDNSRDDGGDPLDKKYSEDDIAPGTLALMRKDCDKFIDQVGDVIELARCKRNSSDCSKDEQAGHDFWLNRNCHGFGFWDGDWIPPSLAKVLSAKCECFGSFDLYVGDDGKVHGQ